jgi:hypothetical protein
VKSSDATGKKKKKKNKKKKTASGPTETSQPEKPAHTHEHHEDFHHAPPVLPPFQNFTDAQIMEALKSVTIAESKRAKEKEKDHKFWSTQPVPKLGFPCPSPLIARRADCASCWSHRQAEDRRRHQGRLFWASSRL